MSVTLAIAIWGAVLATAAILWDVMKWRRSGAQLRISARPNTYYPDRVSGSADDGLSIAAKSLRPFIHIAVANTGTLSTTILQVEARLDRRRRFGHKRDDSITVAWRASAIEPLLGQALPAVLDPGGYWSGRLDQEIVFETREQGFVDHHFYVVVVASHRDGEISKRIFGPKSHYVGRSMTPTSSETV